MLGILLPPCPIRQPGEVSGTKGGCAVPFLRVPAGAVSPEPQLNPDIPRAVAVAAPAGTVAGLGPARSSFTPQPKERLENLGSHSTALK